MLQWIRKYWLGILIGTLLGVVFVGVPIANNMASDKDSTASSLRDQAPTQQPSNERLIEWGQEFVLSAPNKMASESYKFMLYEDGMVHALFSGSDRVIGPGSKLDVLLPDGSQVILATVIEFRHEGVVLRGENGTEFSFLPKS
jgi:hypothetical protein